MYAICENRKAVEKAKTTVGKLFTIVRGKTPASKENESNNGDEDSTSGTDDPGPFGGRGMFGSPTKAKPSTASEGIKAGGSSPFQPPWGTLRSEGGGTREQPGTLEPEEGGENGFDASLFNRGSGNKTIVPATDDEAAETAGRWLIGAKNDSMHGEKKTTENWSGAISTGEVNATSWDQSTAADSSDDLEGNYTAVGSTWDDGFEGWKTGSTVEEGTGESYTTGESYGTGALYTTGGSYATGESYGTGESYATGESHKTGQLYGTGVTGNGTSMSWGDATISSLWNSVNETAVNPSFTDLWRSEESTGTMGDIIKSNISGFFNVSVTASKLLTTTTQRSNFSDYDENSTPRSTVDLIGILTNTEPTIREFIGKFYNSYEFISEAYIMTAVAALGVLANGLAILAMSRDRRIWPMTRGLHGLFFVSEQLFLAMAIAFLQIRSQATNIGWEPDSTKRLEIANYFTAFFGLTQTLSTWLLYVTATESYRTVRQLVDPEKGSEMSNLGGPRDASLIILISLGFFSAYLPPVRVPIYEYFQGENPPGVQGAYHLCNVPLENHWDFALREVPEQDLFYILYYSLGYILLDYVLPFIFICCRDKDIIDVLHRAQKHQELIANYAHVLCTALAVSVMCNVYLVCIALKMVILTFKIFEFANGFVEGATVFFRYLNVYSNFLQILKSSLHLGIVVMYNDRLRGILMRGCQRRKKKQRGGRRRSGAAGGVNRVGMNKSHTITTVV